jgi:hypothetical protein
LATGQHQPVEQRVCGRELNDNEKKNSSEDVLECVQTRPNESKRTHIRASKEKKTQQQAKHVPWLTLTLREFFPSEPMAANSAATDFWTTV